MKNVFVMTARQGQQVGYALDSRWFGIGEYTQFMRERLSALTADQVNNRGFARVLDMPSRPGL